MHIHVHIKREKSKRGKTNKKQVVHLPSKLAPVSFSALSDTPAKSYAPELGRPKGEYRVSYRISLPFSSLLLTYF
jgi:hypothetical protein